MYSGSLFYLLSELPPCYDQVILKAHHQPIQKQGPSLAHHPLRARALVEGLLELDGDHLELDEDHLELEEGPQAMDSNETGRFQRGLWVAQLAK